MTKMSRTPPSSRTNERWTFHPALVSAFHPNLPGRTSPIADITGTGSNEHMLVLQVVGGILVALAIDWAIYTHLSAYLRLGIPTTPALAYSALAGGRSLSVIRTLTVALAGALGGFAYSEGEPLLWLSAVGLFSLAHAVLYVFLYKR